MPKYFSSPLFIKTLLFFAIGKRKEKKKKQYWQQVACYSKKRVVLNHGKI